MKQDDGCISGKMLEQPNCLPSILLDERMMRQRRGSNKRGQGRMESKGAVTVI
jgi:hypothetical protein